MSIWRKKSLEALLQQAQGSNLKRTLGAGSLIALGIGAIIGAGLFVRTAAAATDAAGSGVTLSFIVAAIGCAFAGLCYAEFAAMIPISGSAYAYSFVTMGELVAWVIGWALIMEYALGAATVSIAWSEYLNNLLGNSIPYQWCHSPFEKLYQASADVITQIQALPGNWVGIEKGFLNADQFAKLPAEIVSQVTITSGIMNIPALVILLALTLLLIKGTQESATVNAIIVFVKVAIVLVFIVVGWQFIKPENHTPYLIPEGTIGHEGFFKWGWGGVLGGAAIVFFAFIGFDAVSTTAQEAKKPEKRHANRHFGFLGRLYSFIYSFWSRANRGCSLERICYCR